jgi:D-alanyl-D-alanine carboxypeptidase
VPDIAAAVQRQIAEIAARRGAAGAQYIVVRGGQRWLEHCHGLADVILARPVTPATTFNAYSITKTFTAATVVTLAQAGRLNLDAPIATAAAVEGLEAYGSVRETMLHRAGFRNPNPLKWFHTAQSHHAFDESAFVSTQVRALRGSRRRLARSAYSNIGYLMLGLAIERAWSGSFVQAVRALVLDSIRMQPDQRLAFAIENAESHAHGHLRRHGLMDLTLGLFVDRSSIVQDVGNRWVQLHLHHVNGSAYGGLMANARGLARFGSAVLGAHEATNSAAWRQLLQIVPGPGTCRSLGWFGGKLGRHYWLAHAGGGLGGYGELRIYPQLGAVSALLTNGPGVRDARCLDAVDSIWIDAQQ